MERPGVRRDHFIGAGSYLADTGVALERLGLFLDGCSSAAAAVLPEAEEGDGGKLKPEEGEANAQRPTSNAQLEKRAKSGGES